MAISIIHFTDRSVYHVLSQFVFYISSFLIDATSKMPESYFFHFVYSKHNRIGISYMLSFDETEHIYKDSFGYKL